MKKIFIILGILALFLLVTNPDHDDFGDWVQKQVEKKVQKEIGKDLAQDKLFKDFLKGTAGLTKLISKNATRDNYYLFSVYHLAGNKFLGIAGQFIPLNKIEENFNGEDLKDFNLDFGT